MNHRKISLAAARRVFATLFSACLLAAHSSAQTPTTWNGGTADWENAAFWNNGVPNGPSADAFIDGGKTGIASVVTMQNSETVGRLTLDAGDTLNLNTSFIIQAGAFGGSGSIINNGEIDFKNGGSLNILFYGNTSISGTGTINLFAAGSAFGQQIYSPNGVGDRLTIGAGQTITGSTSSNNGGSLGGGQSTFTNDGTINANTSLDAFVIAPGGGNGNDFTNGPTGIAEASNGGVLVLFGGNFNNGTFQALDNSQVLIQTSALSGATLTTAGSGTIKISSGLITLTNVTNTGTLDFGEVTATIVGGTLVNTGTINLSDGFGGNILYDGDTSISGTGTINLLAAGSVFGDSIGSANGNGERLTIAAGQTITGSTRSNNGGSLGRGNSTITNNGTVNANTSADSLLIQTGGGNGNDFTNGPTGLAEATNGGIFMNIGGVFNNNGTFAVVSGATGGSSSFSLTAGSLTNFAGATLTGGTYNVSSSDPTNTSTLSFGGGTITTNAANVTLDGVNTVFAEVNGLASNQGSFMVANGRNFTTPGALANSGTLVAASGSTLGTNGELTQNGTLLIGAGGAVSVNNNGDYSQGSGASFDIELGEDNPAGFQQLTVSGAAHLGGTLQVALVNGYMPAPGQTFTVIKAAGVDGQFDNVIGATATYTATEVIIQPTQNTATLTLTSAVSRKIHGAAGDFDLPLVLDPATNSTVEPRAGGPTTVVFGFSSDVIAADGMISSNEFTITNASYSSASISGNEITLNLSAVVDQSIVTITLSGIDDTNGIALTGDNGVSIRALVGDANQSQVVDKPDLQGVKDHAGEPLDQMSGNYLFDLDLDGTIGRGDGRVIKMNKLHTVP